MWQALSRTMWRAKCKDKDLLKEMTSVHLTVGRLHNRLHAMVCTATLHHPEEGACAVFGLCAQVHSLLKKSPDIGAKNTLAYNTQGNGKWNF